MIFENSDEEENQDRQPIINQAPNKNCNAMDGDERLMADYLVQDSVDDNRDFKRRFCEVDMITKI